MADAHHETTEKQLLNHTLELLEREGPLQARAYLESLQQDAVSRNRVQIENFRYCLAACCGDKDEALAILRHAIIDEGFWYRPEVFDDGDLESLWNDPEFLRLKKLSEKRYTEAVRLAGPVCTWKKKTSDKILLALHGNQQTFEDAKEQWDSIRSAGIQAEYLQSGELDSFGIYRWEPDGPGVMHLLQMLKDIGWDSYQERILAGFSAGCNVIARAAAEGNVSCNQAILVAPWIPYFEENGYRSLGVAFRDIRVTVLCGEQDSDCLPGATELVKELKQQGVDCTFMRIPGLGHDFPGNFPEILLCLLR